MANLPYFQFTWYPYRSGQINLIQYCVTRAADGSLYPVGQNKNERFIYGYVSPNAYSFSFEDSVNITSVDYANQSMLASDMKNSLGKTLAVFTSHFLGSSVSAADIQGHYNDASVGQFDSVTGNPIIDVDVFTNVSGTRLAAAGGMTIYTITSFLNNVRS